MIKLIASVNFKILYFSFSRPITRSTCMHTRTSSRLVSTSHWLSYGFSLVNAGTAVLLLLPTATKCKAKSSLSKSMQPAIYPLDGVGHFLPHKFRPHKLNI